MAEPRYPLSAIIAAMAQAGLSVEHRSVVMALLKEQAPRRGRRAEDDGGEVLEVVEIAWSKEISLNSAASIVADRYPEHQKEAVRKRLARKAKVREEELRTEIEQAEEQAVRRETNSRLRAIFASKNRD
jgi:hypothetical protein